MLPHSSQDHPDTRIEHTFPLTAKVEPSTTTADTIDGHAHLSTISVYLNHLNPQDVIAAGRADAVDPGLTCGFEGFASGRQPGIMTADGAEATEGEPVAYVTTWGASVNGLPEIIVVHDVAHD